METIKNIKEQLIEKWRMMNQKRFLMITGGVFLLLIIIILVSVFQKNKQPIKIAEKNVKTATETNRLKQQFIDQLPVLQKRVQENPNNMAVQQELGVAKYATGDLQGAKEAYEKASSLDTNNAVVHNNLGNTYRDLGDYAKAESEYRLAMKLNSKLTTPYMNLASIYQYILGKPETALKIYAEGIKNNPEYVDFYNVSANIYEQQGLKDKAKASFKKALEIQPGNPVATAGLKRLEQ